MHFAAFAYVGESVERPAKYYRNNVVGSLNLLEAMQAGAADYLIKGRIDAPLLERSIRYALERARRLEAQEENGQVWSTLARVGQEMIAALDTFAELAAGAP